MKKIFFFFFAIASVGYAQPPGQWMWIHGSNVSNVQGNWGTQGVPSPTNVPPALYEPAQWTDLNGNFWLYGGLQGPDFYAALWKYNPSTNQWTWMKGPNTPYFIGDFGVQGVPSSTNLPPSMGYGAAAWTDLQGNLWLYGGYGGSSTHYGALWKYEIATNTWTWMQGLSGNNPPAIHGTQGVPNINNSPGAREECATAWTDNSGDLWLFGGWAVVGYFNDLWRFNIATNTWTWMKGSANTNQFPVYGTVHVEDSTNTPGARLSYAHWKDNAGNLWLMGGTGLFGSMNDLWRYNILTNNWTWMVLGTSGNDINGLYGALCVDTSSITIGWPTTPGCRYEDRSVITDHNGNFWLFSGGRGSLNYVWNDLWMFCVSTGRWVWQGGQSAPNPTGNWGAINVPSPLNIPDGRVGAVTWYDNNNHIYMFGGSGYPWQSTHNDMWKFTIDPACYICPVLSANITTTNELCYGQCIGTATASASNGYPPYTYVWSNSQTTTSINALCAGVYTVTVTDSLGHSASSSVTITQPALISSNLISTPTDLSCIGSATASPSGGTPPYQLLWSNSSTSATINNLCSNWYSVTITDANDCVLHDSVFVNLNTGIVDPYSSEKFNISPNPFKNSFTINSKSRSGEIIHLNLIDITGRIIISDFKFSGAAELGENLSQGLYNLELITDGKKEIFKLVKL